MRFRIKATVSNGQEEWAEDLGEHEETSRRGLSLAIHALYLENPLAERFYAREVTTGEVLSYRRDAGGFFESVGEVFGGPFTGFEGKESK